jgi:two-component system NtrC family sensor kinase
LQDISYLKELDHIKSDFVHTVSHDLRSPLTSVLGYAELIGRTGPLNEHQTEFMARLQASIRDITALVNDLLDLGRLEAGFDTRREIVQLENIIGYTLDILGGQVSARNITVRFTAGPHLPSLKANPLRLRQMLDNLIGNAIKYTPPGGEVNVHVRAEGGQIILQVTDNGPGIAPSDQPRIFEKFFRGENVPDDVPGSGLGLSIVKSIVDNHQGRIWVESALGQGSTFFVILPAYTPPTA